MLPSSTSASVRSSQAFSHAYSPVTGGPPGQRARTRRGSGSLGTFLKRVIQFPQMDFEFALWQMLYLVIAPRRV
ncbi:hypothetical protein HDU76_003193, partial [Blyttiomyces sp. JEL0837]